MVGRTNEQPRSAADESTDRGRRAGLAAYAVLIAIGAYGGALGLVFGFLSLSAELEQRLPFASPVFGGVALAVIVAAPATVVAALAWRGDPRTNLAAVIDGVLLIGWILVQMAVIRELSYFHLIYATVGVSLVVWGRDTVPQLGHWMRHPFQARVRVHG